MERKRDQLVDILKGIGIASVVVGHSGVLLPGLGRIPTTQFVYLYHLMVFFFAAGMVFKPERYEDPYVYIGKQIKSSYPLYVVYNLIFLVLHNVMADIQMLDVARYDFNDFVIHGCHLFSCHYTETMVSSLWFVPMFLISKALFAVGFDAAEKCKYKILGHAVVISLTAAAGLYTNAWGMFLYNHLQTALLGVPVIYMGYLFSRYKEKLIKFVTPVVCIFSMVIMLGILRLGVGEVDLASDHIISPALFYPVTALGMVFCVSLAEIIKRSHRLTQAFSHWGMISFHIMALHTVVFKVVDWTYGLLAGVERQSMTRFPFAIDNFGLFYCIMGVGIPTLLVWLVRKWKAGLSSNTV